MLIDSNVLVYSFNKSSPKREKAREFIQRNSSKLFLTQQNLLETLRVITSSKFPCPFSPREAVHAIMDISNQATLLTPTHDTYATALELIRKYKIIGAEIFDAYLVATMLTHQVTSIATDNVKHLSKYTEITVENPFS
jgi:predicted nucleic acid-binding protein